ncbi:MAG: AmmeMemoRadiSam system protein B [Puniceicoccales bacterium]|jgi:AmmeMemoRadiSam system protein B/AmmeMemoRadiSam system protein A|nr:AmmeMemoRadiSam system protein B [Puniceicoccales bacterium]
MRRIHSEKVRGTFYSSDATDVERQLRQWSEDLPCYLDGVHMLFVPHAGYVYSGKVATHAYRQLANRCFRRIFILADNHRREWTDRGVAIPNFDDFQIFDRRIPIDQTFCEDLLDKFPNVFSPTEEAYNGHTIEAQLPVLLHFADISDSIMVPLIFQGTSEEERRMLAKYLHSRCGDEDLIVISSDLSHYLPAQAAEIKDRETLAVLLRGQFPIGENCLCGMEALSCACHIAVSRHWICHFVDYAHSGMAVGEMSRVVGYGALAWTQKAIYFSSDVFIALETLVLQCIEYSLARLPPPNVDILLAQFPQLCAHQSVFVTLMKNERLRGCIGGLGDFSRTILDGVQQRATDAAFRDFRFHPVTPEELPQLKAHVSILSFPTELHLPGDQWIGYLCDTHPKPGVILEFNGRTSTFLPEVWEQVPNPRDFLAALCNKQGAPGDAWKSPTAKLLTYTTQTWRAP